VSREIHRHAARERGICGSVRWFYLIVPGESTLLSDPSLSLRRAANCRDPGWLGVGGDLFRPAAVETRAAGTSGVKIAHIRW
jgi:hypothetical protein